MSPSNRARRCVSGPRRAASRWWSVTITAGPTAWAAASCRSTNAACAFRLKPSSKRRDQVRPRPADLFRSRCLWSFRFLVSRKLLTHKTFFFFFAEVRFLLRCKHSLSHCPVVPLWERSHVYKETHMWHQLSIRDYIHIICGILVSLSSCHYKRYRGDVFEMLHSL